MNILRAGDVLTRTMATDGPTPPPCDSDIFNNGTAICVIAGISSNRMERFIRSVAKATRQRVDWNFAGGRAIVRVLGDVGRVRRNIAARTKEIAALEHASYVPWGSDAVRTRTGKWRASGRTYRTRELARIAISRNDGRACPIHWL